MKIGTHRRGKPRGLDDALLPLVNVVFLLMIFFLSAGRFGGPRPVAATPASSSLESRAAAARVLELREGGQLALQGEVFDDGDLPARAIALQGAPLDVKATGQVPAERVLRLLAVLRGAGVRDVRLLTVKSGR